MAEAIALMVNPLVKHSFFIRLCGIVVLGAVVLFWLIDMLANHTHVKMSQLRIEHQNEILSMARRAEQLYINNKMTELERYLDDLEENNKTWTAVVESTLTLYANSTLSDRYLEYFTLGRDVSWKIHLYFKENPVMGVPFADGKTHFLIQLPEHMRPGDYWKATYLLLQFVLPMLFLATFCWVIYRAIMKPLKQLEQATQAFANGQLDKRIQHQISSNDNEFKQVAVTFDQMADCIEQTIIAQRQFIADFSHEIRTPIARLETAITCAEQNIDKESMLQRIRTDCQSIRGLAEDTLTLTWLENEQFHKDSIMQSEEFDLIDLIDTIVEDAQFECPNIIFKRELPDSIIMHSDSRILGQVIENVLRNACRYAKTTIHIRYDNLSLAIIDDGEGVPEKHLDNIFKPFFRVTQVEKSSGFGLGLALCRRQITRLNGHIQAHANNTKGLKVVISLPPTGTEH